MMTQLIVYPVVVAALRLKKTLRDLGCVLVAIVFNAIALALSLLVFSREQGWRVTEALSLVLTFLGTKGPLEIWENVVFLSRVWSQFLHPMIFILSILGVLLLASKRDRFCAIVLAWLVAASVATVVAGMMWDVGYINRAMLLTPFQIPAAVGFVFLTRQLDTELGGITNRSYARLVVAMVASLILLAILNGTLRALFPLLTDPNNYPNPFAP
jgi:hypothetical protein